MDEFKDYLHQHREALDVETPGSEVWTRIQQRTAPVIQPRWDAVYKWVAAAAIVLTAAGVTWYAVLQDRPGPHVAKVQQDTLTEKNVPEITGVRDSPAAIKSGMKADVDSTGKIRQPVIAAPSRPRKKGKQGIARKLSAVDALQQVYAAIINRQLKKLESTPIYVESPDYFHVFKKQWYDLEKDENRLKQDVQLYGLDDNGLMEFIQIHEQKLSLLKQLQQEINKMNSRANRYPGIQQQSPSYLKM